MSVDGYCTVRLQGDQSHRNVLDIQPQGRRRTRLEHTLVSHLIIVMTLGLVMLDVEHVWCQGLERLVGFQEEKFVARVWINDECLAKCRINCY